MQTIKMAKKLNEKLLIEDIIPYLVPVPFSN